MERFKKALKIAGTVAALAFAAVVGIGLQQVPLYLAHRRLADATWMKTASSDDLRRTAHLALEFRLGDPHDAFMLLAECGDRSSVAFLRAALARRPRGDAVPCTWSHAQQALDRILDGSVGACKTARRASQRSDASLRR